MLKQFLDALPIVATHPLAFIAYIAVVISWVILGLQANKIKKIGVLPEKDRLKALELAYPRMPKGASPEVWLKSQEQKFIFAGVVITIAAVTLIVLAIVLYSRYLPSTTTPTRTDEALMNRLVSVSGETDQRKREAVMIELATSGERAMPAVRMALQSSDESIRRFAVGVAVKAYEGGTVDRAQFIQSTITDFSETTDDVLRRGLLECLVRIPNRTESQNKQIFVLLKETLGGYSKPSSREELPSADTNALLLEAARFLGSWSSTESKDLLLGFAEYCRCGGGQRQAINLLPDVAAGLSADSKKEILARLELLDQNAPNSLKPYVTDAIVRIRKLLV
jgi:hypothetical protein